MVHNDRIRRAVRYALIPNLAAAIVVPVAHADDSSANASSANAQTTAAAQPAAQPAAAAAPTEVIVTGSRIVEPGLTSISPVTTVNAAQIQQSGFTRVEDLLNTLPQVMADMGGDLSNAATGEATVNLRGLGPQRTLVLINGRRLMPGDPTPGGVSAADLNNIPAALVERVDVLTGGASSTYGADAVAGVVNFVMNDHFEGLKLDTNVGIYQHSQQEKDLQAALAASGYAEPPSTVWDGNTKDATLIFGHNLADGAGNFTAYLGYRQLDAVLGGSRDFASCTPLPSNYPIVCFGSANGYPGTFIPITGPNAGSEYSLGPGGQFVPFTAADRYNFSPSNYFVRPDTRWTGGNFVHYNLNDKVQVYSELMFMRDVSTSQIAPGAAFLGTGTATAPSGLPDGAVQVNCSNPFLSAQQLGILCGGSTAGDAQFYLGRRNVEGGDRINDLEHTSFRMVAGLKGEFIDGWSYDTYAQEGQTAFTSYTTGNLSKSAISNALNVVEGPNGPVCAGTATGCAPWNIFTIGGVTPAALTYVSIPALLTGYTEERVADGNITGDLGKYNIKSPGASDGLLVNFGAQWRSEGATLHPDSADELNDISGNGGPVLPLNNVGFHVAEGYFEAGMPILQDKPFAKELSFETGYRYSTYDLGFNTNTYKFGLNWAPTSDVRVRASYQRAVRAPNLQELFVEKGLALEGSYDPCAGSTTGFPTASLANCEHTGVTPAQYGKLIPSPAGQYQGLTGGNPTLKPEQADTTSFGFVITPSMLPNASFTIDYFNIFIKDVISSYGFALQLNNCLSTDNPVFCGDVHRDSFGTLWASPEGYVNDPTLNLGALQARGVDGTAAYKLDLNSFGRINFNLVGTYTVDFVTKPGGELGEQRYNCAGYYGTTCGVPQPKWKDVFTTTYDTPIEGFQAGMRWRYLTGVTDDALSPNPLLSGTVEPPYAHIGSYQYFDLFTSYIFNKNLSVRAGVNNVLDKDPPFISSEFINPPFNSENTFPQVYDSLGRYIFANVTLTF
jgi:iron complex outermembrane recepter protein